MIYQTNLPRGRGAGFTIRRGQASCCAYFMLPAEHPLVREFPNDSLPVYPHAGITFAGPALWQPTHWAWGWDYAHAGDDLIFPAEVEAILTLRLGGRVWLPDDVLTDSQNAITEFGALCVLAEQRPIFKAIWHSSKTRPRRALAAELRRRSAPMPQGPPKLREPFQPGSLAKQGKQLAHWVRNQVARRKKMGRIKGKRRKQGENAIGGVLRRWRKVGVGYPTFCA